MIGVAAQTWLLTNVSKILAAPIGHKFQNGLMELTCISLMEMSLSFFIYQKPSREYCHYAISHYYCMFNFLPVKLYLRLMTPHKLVYGVKSDTHSWFQIFYIGCFHHKKYRSISRYATKSQTLAVISIGLAKKLNTMQFYNPVSRSIYTTA